MVYARLSFIGAPAPATPPTPAELDKMTVGAAVAPEQIKAPRQARRFRQLLGRQAGGAETGADQCETGAGTQRQPGVDLFVLTADSLNSTLHGYLAVPKSAAASIPPWSITSMPASIRCRKAWSPIAPRKAGWHWMSTAMTCRPTRRPRRRITRSIGNDSRETSYFLNMYLRDTRALDFIQSRPDWDGKTIVIIGTSMGGQQSFVTAGLNPGRVTAMIVNVPAGADFSGDLHGSKHGYPNWPVDDPKVVETARYFDAMNFAPSITAQSLVAFGFIDTTSPPFGVLAAFNPSRARRKPRPCRRVRPQQHHAAEGRRLFHARESGAGRTAHHRPLHARSAD